jgi:predicted nucleotidyltransferase
MPIDESQIERCKAIAREFGVKRLILFGSALETPATARDIDLACDGVDGWRFFELAARLEDQLNMPVDLVRLHPETPFVRYITQKGRVIYEHQ